MYFYSILAFYAVKLNVRNYSNSSELLIIKCGVDDEANQCMDTTFFGPEMLAHLKEITTTEPFLIVDIKAGTYKGKIEFTAVASTKIVTFD